VTVQKHRYPAFSMKQTIDSKPLVLFSAPATDIAAWVGVPQRGRLDGGETVGFQRQENPARVKELANFFTEPRNVVQNPLLCALQADHDVTFVFDDEEAGFGHIEILQEDLESLTLLDLIERVIFRLETRVPNLTGVSLDQERLTEVVRRASEAGFTAQEDAAEEDNDLEEDALRDPDVDSQEDTAGDVASVLLTEETQLVDFYQELRVRADVLRRLTGEADPPDLLGFSKDAMISYLKPVVLVDGQHRLRGAVLSATQAADTPSGREEVRAAVDAGEDPTEAQRALVAAKARSLPVSLLLDASPSEHVFQFVVVNQKATPMGKALLGTIVSTSLSRDELDPVAQRLRDAGIRLEDSQAVAYLTRAEESPFRNLVQTGVIGDESGHLQWNVLKGLTSIFRELRGGRLYHQTVDYAAKWRRRELLQSAFVADGADAEEKFKIWSAPDGPWRAVFIRFFTLVQQKFADSDREAHNAWGWTTSNLYNKITLTILSADFFQFLDDHRLTLNSIEDVDEAVGEWLEGVSEQYFSRDFRMGSLKKDQGPVQKRWAEVWFEYRKDPQRLPRVERYRP
jgi:hypothetical protein